MAMQINSQLARLFVSLNKSLPLQQFFFLTSQLIAWPLILGAYLHWLILSFQPPTQSCCRTADPAEKVADPAMYLLIVSF